MDASTLKKKLEGRLSSGLGLRPKGTSGSVQGCNKDPAEATQRSALKQTTIEVRYKDEKTMQHPTPGSKAKMPKLIKSMLINDVSLLTYSHAYTLFKYKQE